MKSIDQICKEFDIQLLEQQIEEVNNQLSKLEEKSIELSSKIILAKRQLEIMKGFTNGTERS